MNKEEIWKKKMLFSYTTVLYADMAAAFFECFSENFVFITAPKKGDQDRN